MASIKGRSTLNGVRTIQYVLEFAKPFTVRSGIFLTIDFQKALTSDHLCFALDENFLTDNVKAMMKLKVLDFNR